MLQSACDDEVLRILSPNHAPSADDDEALIRILTPNSATFLPIRVSTSGARCGTPAPCLRGAHTVPTVDGHGQVNYQP